LRTFLQLFLVSIPIIISFSTLDPVLSIRFVALSFFISVWFLFEILNKKHFNYNIFKQPVIIVFIIILVLSCISMLINNISSESTYSLLRLFMMLFLIIILSNFFQKNNYRLVIKPLIIFSLTLIIIYIIQFLVNYERIMLIDIDWKRNLEFDKISSTMANKNLLSSILFLLLPFTFYGLNKEKNLWKFLSAASIILFIFIILQTQTKAVIIALLLFLFSYLILIPSKIKMKIKMISFLVLIIFSFFLTKIQRFEKLKEEFTTISNFKNSTRYNLYISTIKLINDNLVFGVGPGSWKINISKYGLYNNKINDVIAQRPHNDILWIASESGLFSGICYIIIFLILIRDSYKLFSENKEKIIYLLIFSTLIGYLFISLVDFPLERISHNIVFCVLSSIVISSNIKEDKSSNISTKSFISYVFLGISLLSCIVSINRYVGEYNIAEAIKYKSKKNWEKVISYSTKAHNPFFEMENTSTPIKWYSGIAYFNLKEYELALKSFKDSYKINPYHVHVINNYATTLHVLGNTLEAKKKYQEVFKINHGFKDARINMSAILYNEKKYVESLKMILLSKVEPYWKRLDNDNYDNYIRNIIHAWYLDNISKMSVFEKNKIENLLRKHEKNPKKTSDTIVYFFKKNKEKKMDFRAFLLNIKH